MSRVSSQSSKSSASTFHDRSSTFSQEMDSMAVREQRQEEAVMRLQTKYVLLEAKKALRQQRGSSRSRVVGGRPELQDFSRTLRALREHKYEDYIRNRLARC
jgi:regulator of sirC expression with transglutaminase-like and TPR domain